MEAHDMLQAAHDTIGNKMLIETVAVAAGKEQGVDIPDVMLSLTKQRHSEANKGTI